MCKIINQKNINGYSHVKNNLSTGYSLKMWIVYKILDKIVKIRKNKKDDNFVERCEKLKKITKE